MSPAAAAEDIETEKLPNSDEVVSEAINTQQFREVRSSLEEMGFETDMNRAVAKKTNAPERVGYKHGVLFPLRRVLATDVWGDSVDEHQLSVNGYILWSRLLDGSVSATGLLFGTSADDVSDPSLPRVLESHSSSERGVVAFVEPTGVEASVIGEPQPNLDEPVTTGESIKQCILDNTGVAGSVDDIVTCSSCLSLLKSPILITKASVLACAWCFHSLHIQHCLLMYCGQKANSEAANDHCDMVQQLADTPFDLLPGSYGSSIMITLRSQEAGCDADEGNDCTSPFIE